MYDPHAAQAAADASIEETHQQLPRFIDGEPVEIQLVLDDPVCTPKFPEDLRADAVAQVAQLFAGFHSGVPGNAVTKAFVQRLAVIALPLGRDGLRERARVLGPVLAP